MPDTAPPPESHRLKIGDDHRRLLNQVLDTWSVHVLEALCDGPARFNELRRAIPAVTQKSLVTTLRRLERHGIVDRRVVRTRPVAVEYRITPLGKTLREPVDALLAWVDAHRREVEAAQRRFDDELDDGEPDDLVSRAAGA
ncbi:winged helix-turn-helix transcriptional regulator [Cellulosimicrobium funkei]|uniref:Transcriptional regulator n=1 Tax=Cellulosimicrobium funkei TaxID=264251 RepID=A0A4Y8R3B9_9MICO|nr:helix-turn-helix domain-containing protein [Cellulosimicrobium funkei]TFF12629.1 transcriptional regulator [Cellulosimicrobium funkei]TGA77252.1 transcriptional regulator [Cellulosimicrobium terreum]